MADTKISAMTDGGRIANGDVFPAVRAGANIKVSAGGGTVGLQMYNAVTTAAAIAILGGTAVGNQLFTAATSAAARASIEAVGSVVVGTSGASAITNMVSLTSANYASLTPGATTLYFITDAS